MQVGNQYEDQAIVVVAVVAVHSEVYFEPSDHQSSSILDPENAANFMTSYEP